ncbi:MAG: hypothetical protein JWO73_538 [Candidatus Taylorbacteria bacterium]|nr:hypothetical protein [Candidatus Taylorbacteria bacterium]
MNLLAPKSVEDIILSLLQHGERKTTELLMEVGEMRPNTTKQGFYAALRKLRAQEIAIVYKGVASLHTTWIGEMRDKIASIAQAYTLKPDAFDIFSLKEKESLSYTCYTPQQLDSFWGHIQTLIMHTTAPREPIFTIDPHYWLYIARRKTELRCLEEIHRSGRQFLIIVNKDAKLDRAIKRDFVGDNSVQYHIEKVSGKNSRYVSIIGNYVIDVTLDPAIADRIEKIYAKHENVNPNLVHELQSLLEIRSRSKIKISRNRARAAKFRSSMSQYFYIVR